MSTLQEDIRHVRGLRASYDEKRVEADAAELEYKRAQDALWERMDAEGVTSMRIDGRLTEHHGTIYGSISDKSKFIEWAEENEPELVAPAPRAALVNEMVRQRIDNGEELPPGVNWYVRKVISDKQ